MNAKRRVKKFFRNFVGLTQAGDDLVAQAGGNVLVVDNGYASLSHLDEALGKIKRGCGSNVKISVITFIQRNDFIMNRFPEAGVIIVRPCFLRRYALANEMLRARRMRHDFIVVLSLDVSPLLAAVFMKGKVLLFNQWHQWWRLDVKSPFEIFVYPVKLFFDFFIFLYLFIAVAVIFIKSGVNRVLDRSKGC